MNKKILNHYLEFGMYTHPGLYKNKLKKELPKDVREIGDLVRRNLIHRTTLVAGNIGTNADKKFGDMTKVPWYRQPEDDNLITASAMLTELYRRDKRGFVKNRTEKDKLVLTCRFVAILIASILKSKSIPCRVRAGHAPYFEKGKSGDHWINQYWNVKEKRWVTIDVDGSWSLIDDFDPYDVPEGKFDFPAKAWLDVRAGKDNPSRFWNAGRKGGDINHLLWSLFYDFHSLMNSEVIYTHVPTIGHDFNKLDKTQIKKIDELAELMNKPDENLDKLKKLWETKKEFRLVKGSLI